MRGVVTLAGHRKDPPLFILVLLLYCFSKISLFFLKYQKVHGKLSTKKKVHGK
jgi:hypothetical protein